MKQCLLNLIFFPCLLCAGLKAQESTPPTPAGFQPEIGFVLDGILNAGNFSNSSADMRLAELSVSSRLGPAARAFSIIEFLSEGEVDVPEAVVVFDDLGEGLELRAGRMLMDVGKWNTVHVHDLPTPFGDPVRANLFGGGLSGTGLEIHHWQVWGENPVRYSLGLWTQAEAHGHLEEDEEEGHDEHEHGGGWNIEKPFFPKVKLTYNAADINI